MPLSHFFIVSSTGDTLISRNLRGESNKGSSDDFYKYLRENGNEIAPIFIHNNVIYTFIKRANLYFVFTTTFLIPPSYVLTLLQTISNTLKDFCGTLSEESLRQNFILAYELLDEMLNFGYVQCTDNTQLKNKIHNLAVTKKIKNVSSMGGVRTRTRTVPCTVSQRPLVSGGNNKSEIFVDVLEKMSVVITDDNYRGVIEGQIKIKSFLYNSPQIQLALNEDLIINKRIKRTDIPILDFCSFHNTIDIKDFEKSRILIINHIDGEFTAMSYRVTGNFTLPFKIKPTLYINNHQSVEYKSDDNVIIWTIPSMIGLSEVILQSKMTFNSCINRKEFGPINLKFEAPLYNASNLKVRYLRILQPLDYCPSYRWVRYVTTSNSYLYRF